MKVHKLTWEFMGLLQVKTPFKAGTTLYNDYAGSDWETSV